MREHGRVSWSSAATFYVVACALWWPFFWWRDLHAASWEAWDTMGIPKGLAPAMGPAVGALLALWLFRRTHRRTVRLLGTPPRRSLAFAAVPVTLLTVVGIGIEEPHWTGLLTGLAYLAYALGEELGWRGFLRGALRPLPPLRRYGLVGLLWGAWHLTTFTPGPWLEVAVMLHLAFDLPRALPARQVAPVVAPSAVAWFPLLRG
jgi:hypothetical protein